MNNRDDDHAWSDAVRLYRQSNAAKRFAALAAGAEQRIRAAVLAAVCEPEDHHWDEFHSLCRSAGGRQVFQTLCVHCGIAKPDAPITFGPDDDQYLPIGSLPSIKEQDEDDNDDR